MSGIHMAGNDNASFSPTQLFAGESKIVTNTYMAADTLVLAANSIVAFDASGNLIEWVPAANDVTGDAVGITCEAIDNTDGAKSQPIYVGGYFNTDALVWPDGTTDAQKKDAFIGSQINHRNLGYSG